MVHSQDEAKVSARRGEGQTYSTGRQTVQALSGNEWSGDGGHDSKLRVLHLGGWLLCKVRYDERVSVGYV